MKLLTDPVVSHDHNHPYMPHQQQPILEAELTDGKLASFIGPQFSMRGYNQWMEAVSYPLVNVSPSDRARLITLCNQMSRHTPQWQRLLDFDQPDILSTLRGGVPTNQFLMRNQQLKGQLYRPLLEGMPESDPSHIVFANMLTHQQSVLGDQITLALSQANTVLNTFLINTQRFYLCEHNKKAGYYDPVKGYGFWPDPVPMDFMFDKTVDDAWQIFDEVCKQFSANREEESVRSRLLKEAALAEENRYWTGIANSHTEVLADIHKFIPMNIAELNLPSSEADILTAIRDLFGLDRRRVTKELLQEGQRLLNLYLHHAQLEPRSATRAPLELAIACTVALQMRRSKAKWPVIIHGVGRRYQSAYQALKPLVDDQSLQISPSLRALLCGAVSMALSIETERGMGSFDDAVRQKGKGVRYI